MHLFSCFSLFWINNQILSLNNSSTLFSSALFNFNYNYVVIYWVRLGFYLVFSFLLFYLDNKTCVYTKTTHSKRMNNFSVLFGYRSKYEWLNSVVPEQNTTFQKFFFMKLQSQFQWNLLIWTIVLKRVQTFLF